MSANIPAMFSDGTSNTIVFGERYTVCGMMAVGWAMGMCGNPPTWPYSFTNATFPSLPLPQPAPSQANCDSMRLQSPYSGGLLVSMGDGSVRMISGGVSQYCWNLALNPADGMVFDGSW